MLLALETSTNVCSVAFKDDEDNLFEKRIEKRGSHSEKLFLFIEELMEEQGLKTPELQAMLISQGPGSYTGLRIGASAVKGLLFQTAVPLYAVDTLAGFAQAALDSDQNINSIHAVIDARRVHLYHQQLLVQDQRLEALSEVEILPIDTIQQTIEAGM
ncbi:MAG: tRNA (adenosine(37)-N6)-threonylcarbamoyltransferase complex dimerization subunit type 1 TsaB [Balneolaceae bacterium]|nr:tRNA (adenosine(37)-N6)-threonylcarbamoyltransferase complex dimerization subunit type 1 TsaB [Balneolaceae bacterium]